MNITLRSSSGPTASKSDLTLIKHRKKNKQITGLDEFDKCIVHRLVLWQGKNSHHTKISSNSRVVSLAF